MKRYRKLISLFVVLCLLFCMSVNAFAANYAGDDVVPGLSGIQPGDSLTLPNNTNWATLTARWGVRVTFIDWDETELKTEVVPVSDTTSGSTTTPDDPVREGHVFTGWERYDTTAGTATIENDDNVTGITGPGPIVFIATYIARDTVELTISKEVIGSDTDSSFPFEVTLNDAADDPVLLPAGTYTLDGSVSYTVDVEGKITFNLKHQENAIIKDIPVGTLATVKETGHDGYTALAMEESVEISNTDTVQDLLMDTDRAIIYYNYNYPTVVFKKIEASTEETEMPIMIPIQGVTFALYGADELGNMNAEPLEGYEALVSGEDGVFSPEGLTLPYGTYYLKEVSARGGYVELTDPIRIVVADVPANAVSVSATGNNPSAGGNPSVSFENDVYTITVENDRVSPNIPVAPVDPVYVPDEPADVTLKKQIDYLGDNDVAHGGGEGTEDLYRLYLSLQTECIEPMDLLLVIDQSGSMGDCINADTYYYDIDLDDLENEGFEYDDDYEGWLYFDEETGYVLYYDDWYGLALITDFGEDEEEWWDYEGYDNERGWYFRIGYGDTRQEALLKFLNGEEENHHLDGFINLFRNANPQNRLAILSFSDDCSMTSDRYLMEWDDTALAIDPPEPDGATNYAAAFDIANRVLVDAEDSPNRKVMIFLSDGAPTLAYADGEMHHGFDETENETSVIGTGNNYSLRTLCDYINMFIDYHEQDDMGDGWFDYADAWDDDINGYTISYDDDGNPHSTTGHFIEPYSTSDMEHPAYEWPLTYDLTEMDLNIPGTAFPEWDITDQDDYDDFVSEWNNMTETERINWLKLHTQPGEGYNIFYLSESAFAEFSSYNTDVPVFAIFFSDDAEKTLSSGTHLNEVLKYMSGDEHPDAPTERYHHYQSVDSAEALSKAIMSITGLRNVKITDPLSEYVDVAEAPQLEIKLTNAAYSSHSDYPYLYQNGAFTDLGELLLNTSATKIDLDTKTVNVVFKPDHIFTGEFECEASFNVLVNEYAYETYAQDGYNAAGDPFTDYPGNTTSSEKPGFYSNDGATAEWTYYGENSGDYRKPVVQVRFTGIRLKKVAMGDRDLALEGAEFDLYRELDSDTDSDITYTDETGTHYLQKVNQDVLISGNDGIVEVDGLCTGQYYLFETKAPAGYNRLEKPVLFSIVQGGEIGFQIVHSITDANADVDDTDDLLLLIRNSTGYELPETGGIGTPLYTLGGLILMASTLMYGCMMRRRRERRSE